MNAACQVVAPAWATQTLTKQERQICRHVAIARVLSDIEAGRGPTHGEKRTGAVTRHILGAQGECAGCKALGVFWPFSVDNFKGADAGRMLEFRTTEHPSGHLLMWEQDKADRTFVLLTARGATFRIVGFIAGLDGKNREKFWDDGSEKSTRGAPGFWIPQSALRHDLDELLVIAHAPALAEIPAKNGPTPA